MESRVIVVGDPLDPEIRTLLASMRQIPVDVRVCPNACETAACLADRPAGVLFGRMATLLKAEGELLQLAVEAGWQCGLLVDSDTPRFPWNLLARFATRVHVVQARDEAWHSLVAACSLPPVPQAAIKPEYLASPEEIASLLEGTEYV
jgi:hypothetical protein